MNRNKIKLLEKESITLWEMYAQQMDDNTENMVAKLDFSLLPELKGNQIQNDEIAN
jgi:hypothetical protein